VDLHSVYHNEISEAKQEVDRVLELGRKHECLFNQLKNEAVELVGMGCFGRGPITKPPEKWVGTDLAASKELLNKHKGL